VCGIGFTVDLDRRGRAQPWAQPFLAHRGPDSSGVERSADGNAVFEHTRLAIIDPENREADQPFQDPTGRWSLIFNGEIFNYRDIRAELERSGIRFRTSSDTEVVLLGFIEWRERLLDRLIGMFAFAIRDSETGELFAARDQVGVKPLYYFVRDGILAGASEVRPLLAHPFAARDLDEHAFVEYLAFGHNFGDRTLVSGLKKLPPGHYLRSRAGTIDVVEYWDAFADGPSLNGNSPTEALRHMLDDAIGASLVADVPLGMMLSGGLDSSSIAASAARHGDPSALTAYSVSFGRADDESQTAATLARDLGISHRTILLTRDRLADEFDRWLAQLDYPGDNPTWIASAAIARAARADGIKVLLSGDGGDELFGGYDRWMKYLRFHDGVWARTPDALRRVAGRSARPLARGLAGDIAARAAAGSELFFPSRPFHDDVLRGSLGPRGSRALAEAPPMAVIEPLRRQFAERSSRAGYLGWMSYVSLKTKFVEDFLQRLDKMGMQHSVEGRVPLVDPRLVRFAFGLDQEIVVPQHRQKALFRSAVSQSLPEYIRSRPKQGFCPPTAAWAEELLAQRRPDGTPLVEAGLLARGAADTIRSRGGVGASFATWTLDVLLAWLHRNVWSTGVTTHA
jgi:asparagine synthase (glutamine-hydrolysing)